jgi:hypothetical protein
VDLEAFIEWLRERGLEQEQLDAYRSIATELRSHPSLSAALLAAQEAGATPKRIQNMRLVAARLAEFEELRLDRPSATVEAPRQQLPSAVAKEPRPDLATIDVEPPARARQPRDSRPPSSEPEQPARGKSLARDLGLRPKRLGCECREGRDVYLDTDFGPAASMIGGGIGIGTIILIRFVGVLGAAAIALWLASAGGLATALTICFRCEGCRCTIRTLDDDEKAHLRKGRARVTLVTAGLLAGAVLCSVMWWRLASAQLRENDLPSMPADSYGTPMPGSE